MLSKATLNFTGDIMADINQNNACKTGDGFDYNKIFKAVSAHLWDADYCVGNLETPIAGESYGYSEKLYSFNTPKEFLGSLKNAGFNMLTTANNHCLDRGIQGLLKTIENLEEYDFDHIGTYKSEADRNQPFIRNINGIKIAFVNYTYGTNAFVNHCFLKENERFAINLFQPQETRPGSIHLLNNAEKISNDVIKLYYQPNSFVEEVETSYLAKLSGDIKQCRHQGADFIFVIMHSGGQYNPAPDAYTEYLVQKITLAGADMIIGHHPHVVQQYTSKPKGIPVAYSLGNFSFTPEQSPESRDNPISATSIILKVELQKNDNKTKISKIQFVLSRSATQPDGKTLVLPLYDLIKENADPDSKKILLEENQYIVNQFRGLPENTRIDLRREYEIPQLTTPSTNQ